MRDGVYENEFLVDIVIFGLCWSFTSVVLSALFAGQEEFEHWKGVVNALAQNLNKRKHTGGRKFNKVFNKFLLLYHHWYYGIQKYFQNKKSKRS